MDRTTESMRAWDVLLSFYVFPLALKDKLLKGNVSTKLKYLAWLRRLQCASTSKNMLKRMMSNKFFFFNTSGDVASLVFNHPKFDSELLASAVWWYGDPYDPWVRKMWKIDFPPLDLGFAEAVLDSEWDIQPFKEMLMNVCAALENTHGEKYQVGMDALTFLCLSEYGRQAQVPQLPQPTRHEDVQTFFNALSALETRVVLYDEVIDVAWLIKDVEVVMSALELLGDHAACALYRNLSDSMRQAWAERLVGDSLEGVPDSYLMQIVYQSY